MTGDLEKLRKEVLDAGGLKAYEMRQVRDAAGIVKLGKDNVKRISSDLEAHGLGHIPPQLPTLQEDPVRIYAKSERVGKMIEAVLRPTSKGDEYLLDMANSDRSAEIIDRIRALVALDGEQ